MKEYDKTQGNTSVFWEIFERSLQIPQWVFSIPDRLGGVASILRPQIFTMPGRNFTPKFYPVPVGFLLVLEPVVACDKAVLHGNM